ncbi:MAG: hypothetical protein C4523_10120, partial [Myxococcales bacterium]
LFSKTYAIFFPAGMIAVDLALLRDLRVRPLAARALGYLPFVLFNLWFIRVSLAVSLQYEGFHDAFAASTFEGYIPNRLYLVGQILARYLGLVVWPDPLTVQYLYALKQSLGDRRLWLDLLAVAALLGLTIGLLARRRRWAFPFLFFLTGLLPGVGIVPSSIYWADRYLYFSLLGPAMLLGLGAAAVDARSWKEAARRAAQTGIGIVLVAWTVTAALQAGRWRDSATLFGYTLDRDPANHLAAALLAEAQFAAGKTDEAWRANEIAYRLTPDRDTVLSLRGVLMYERDPALHDAAIDFLKQAAERHPAFSFVRKNLALMFARRGAIDEAIKYYQQSVEQSGRSPADYLDLADFLLAIGRPLDASETLDRAAERQRELGLIGYDTPIAERRAQIPAVQAPREAAP